MSALPREWTTDRLKDVATINGSSLPANTDPDYEFDYLEISNVNYHGVIDPQAIERLRYENAPSRARRRVQRGNTLVSSVRPNLQAAAFIDDDLSELVCSTGFNVVQPRESKLRSKFAYYSLISEVARQYFEATAKGVGYPAVDDKDFNSVDIPLPPVPEQELIAAYLDASCAAIDAAAATKRQQIGILTRLEDSLINDFVSGRRRVATDSVSESHQTVRNYEHDSRLRGIFGDSPEGWHVDRIRDLLGPIVGGEWGEDPAESDEGVEIAVIRVADIRGLDISCGDLTVRRVKASKLATRLVGGRTVLLEKSGGGQQSPVGRAVHPRNLKRDAICSNFMAKSDCGPNLDPRFLVYLLHALYTTAVNTAHIQQTTGIQNLRVFDYLNTRAAFPPAGEQARIVKEIDRLRGDLAVLKEVIERQIDSLTSYRKSLIHECVTGQRRVTEADLKRAQAHG